MTEEQVRELADTTARSKSNTHRLDEVEKRLSDNEQLITSVALMAQKQQVMEEDIRVIKTDVKTLTEKPGKRWEQMTSLLISSLAAGIIGYLLAAGGFVS